jgi:thymidylate synthase
MKSFNEVYKQILSDLWYNGMETAPRGMKVKELLGYSFKIDPRDNIITIPGFETNIEYAKEELEWYYSGSNRIDYSPKIQKVWSRYSDDGITVNSNYGHRVFGHKPGYINQWDWTKNKLTEDKDSRQAVININDITDKFNPTKDFPCTMNIQAFIRDDKLHWVVGMRSNDIFLGLRNDAYCFTEMQKKMAAELSVGVGEYIHNAGSMHLYEKNFDKVQNLLGDYK